MTSFETTSTTATLAAPTPRMAIATVFLCFGLTVGLWGGSVAEVLRAGDMSPAILGSAFLAFSVAGILGMAVAGRVRRSASLKARLIVLIVLTAACLAALFHVRTESALVVGLFTFSFLSACVDLVMNSEDVAVETERGVPLLAGFHGLASLGIGCGALAGSYLSVTFGLGVTGAVCVAIYGVALAAVALGTPSRGPTRGSAVIGRFTMPSAMLVVIGLIVGTSIACEMASVMFSAQTMAAQSPEFAAYAGLGATAFALFQAAVRFAGDRIRRVFTDALIIGVSLAATFVGFTVVATAAGLLQTAAGFAMVGIGTACIVPCGFAIASRDPAVPAAAAISVLAMVGAVVRVPAPLIYGELADRIGFTPGFWLYACTAAGALALASVALAGKRTRSSA